MRKLKLLKKNTAENCSKSCSILKFKNCWYMKSIVLTFYKLNFLLFLVSKSCSNDCCAALFMLYWLWFLFRGSYRLQRSQRAEHLWLSELWVGGLCLPGVELVFSVSLCGKSSVFTAYVSAGFYRFDILRHLVSLQIIFMDLICYRQQQLRLNGTKNIPSLNLYRFENKCLNFFFFTFTSERSWNVSRRRKICKMCRIILSPEGPWCEIFSTKITGIPSDPQRNTDLDGNIISSLVFFVFFQLSEFRQKMQTFFPSVPKSAEARAGSEPLDWDSVFKSKWSRPTRLKIMRSIDKIAPQTLQFSLENPLD